MHRLTFLNIAADTLMQTYLWYFTYSDILIFTKNSYIATAMLFSVPLQK